MHPSAGSGPAASPARNVLGGELESCSRCFLTFEDEYVQGRALPVRHEGGRDYPRRLTHTGQQVRREKLPAALDRLTFSGLSNHDGVHCGSLHTGA